MSRGGNVARRIATPSGLSINSLRICRSCLATLRNQRRASTATHSMITETSSQPIQSSITATSRRTFHQVKASVVLSRPPLLTRDLAPFEKAHFLYQRRLNERLVLPFTRYFYYPKGTPSDVEWKRKIRDRQTPARDIGIYNAYSEEGWNDELLVGAKESEPIEQVEALLRDAEVLGIEGEEGEMKKEIIEKPMPRLTEADRTEDVKSLNRALQRTLYLLVKNGEGRWGFPNSELVGKESLHMAAERILVQSAGINMNTWVVGNVPIGHQNVKYPQGLVDQEKGIEQLGEKLFFMKARIMAGQANLTDNKLGLEDFKWLAKDEIQKAVSPQYWNAVRNMLAER